MDELSSVVKKLNDRKAILEERKSLLESELLDVNRDLDGVVVAMKVIGDTVRGCEETVAEWSKGADSELPVTATGALPPEKPKRKKEFLPRASYADYGSAAYRTLDQMMARGSNKVEFESFWERVCQVCPNMNAASKKKGMTEQLLNVRFVSEFGIKVYDDRLHGKMYLSLEDKPSEGLNLISENG